ncbi:MAG: MBL fold metallo-hydrolase [Methanobacteriota archaeon]|nr:MAG: MBL fold metallo-hydrolase [Euryarchaeota archaeon]
MRQCDCRDGKFITRPRIHGAMRVTTFTAPPLKNNAYLVVDDSSLDAAVIDPGLAGQKILDSLKLSGASVKFILNTHGHADHTADDAKVKAATGAKVGIHEVDAFWFDRNAKSGRPYLQGPALPVKGDLLLKEGSEIKLGNTVLVTMHTPGHTLGSAVFYVASEGVLFSGDTVMAGSSGRTDLQDGSPAKMGFSLKRLYRDLPADTRVLPGHGPETTLRRESWIADLSYPLIR